MSADRCRRCGAALAARQRWCLRCGEPARTMIAPAPRRVARRATVAALGALLALAALGYALAALAGS